MRAHAIIHVAGPKGAGKTALVELLVGGFDGFVLVARCTRDDKLKRLKETAPKTDPELRRYRQAGASGTALFAFPNEEIGTDSFFCTDLMTDYSHVVVIEGDSPAGFADVEVFVAPPLKNGEDLLVRRKRDRAGEERDMGNSLEKLLLQNPEAIAELFGQMIGAPLADAMKKNPKLMEKGRADMLEGIAKSRKGNPAKPTEHWAIADGYTGIEHAGVIIVNVRTETDREGAQRLLMDLERLRKDQAVFDDVLGWRGKKTPVTAVIGDLSSAKDAGTKKALKTCRSIGVLARDGMKSDYATRAA